MRPMQSTGVKDKAGTIMYALGQTQHTVAVQNIRTMCMVQLLLGNIGICGGGVNALRGEPNVQGSTDFALLYHYSAGIPGCAEGLATTLDEYLKKNTPKSADPRSVNWWQNFPKYIVSLLKAWFGDKATKENDFGYSWVPKLDDGQNAAVLNMIDHMSKEDKRLHLIATDPA